LVIVWSIGLPGVAPQSVLLWDETRIEMMRVAKGHIKWSIIT
jgi:hypothetical protein